MILRKQDPSVIEMGTKRIFVNENILAGPKNELIEIHGLPAVTPDANGDFLPDPIENEKAFDAVHTFAAVWRVVDMYKRVIRYALRRDGFTWQWGSDPIEIHPYYGSSRGAWYRRRHRRLEFHRFQTGGRWIFSCRSFDLVAHETGHAVLDALKPGWYPTHSYLKETAGLHEGFADLTAIFSLINQLDLCEDVVVASRSNLHAKNFLPLFAEEYGNSVNLTRGFLRNADNDLTFEQGAKSGKYGLSQVFTGAIYDILADLYELQLVSGNENMPAALYESGRYLLMRLVQAVDRSPDYNASILDVGVELYKSEARDAVKKSISVQFQKRGLDVTDPSICNTAANQPDAVNFDADNQEFCGSLD